MRADQGFVDSMLAADASSKLGGIVETYLPPVGRRVGQQTEIKTKTTLGEGFQTWLTQKGINDAWSLSPKALYGQARAYATALANTPVPTVVPGSFAMTQNQADPLPGSTLVIVNRIGPAATPQPGSMQQTAQPSANQIGLS